MSGLELQLVRCVEGAGKETSEKTKDDDKSVKVEECHRGGRMRAPHFQHL
jgi:hypothetical protein